MKFWRVNTTSACGTTLIEENFIFKDDDIAPLPIFNLIIDTEGNVMIRLD